MTPSSSSPPRNRWSRRYGCLIPLGLVAVAAVTLLLRTDPEPAPENCAPQDPVLVRVADRDYAIPAVLLPHLYLGNGMVPVVRQNSRHGILGNSRAGSRLARWYCASEDGAPIPVRSFSVHDDQIANAVAEGKLDYRLLGHLDTISVEVAPTSAMRSKQGLTLDNLARQFPVHCTTAATYSYPHSPDVTVTPCRANVAASPETLLMVRFHIQAWEGGPTINAPEDWPEIAREVQHLIRSLQVTPE